MEKNVIQNDPSFVFQEEGKVSVAALQDKKDKEKFDAINNVLSRTNYEEHMQRFIESSEQILYLRFSEDIIHDMPKCHDCDIQKAVHNIFPVKTWLFNNELIVGYGKRERPDGYPFMKTSRLFLTIGLSYLILFAIFCICIAIMIGGMSGGRSAFCFHHSIFCGSVLVTALVSGLCSAVGWFICNVYIIVRAHLYIDRKSVALLPVIHYKDII